MMEAGADQKFVLRMTCLKNGGFRKYQSLPPQEVFKHAYWVLAADLEVKIKQKQTFFTRKTDWMRLPVYLAINKGLLFVYATKDSGYALRVSAASKLNFEATKQKQKKKNKNNQEEYSAQISLQFQFGEIEMKFENAEVCRSWRAILLVAHESPKELAMLGKEVAKDFFKKSPSLESVVSAKSVFPEDGDKDKSERVEVHRHPIVESPRSENNISASSSSSSVASSVVQYPSHPPAFFVGDYRIPEEVSDEEEELPTAVEEHEQPIIVKEAGSNSSLWDEEEGEELEESKTQSFASNNYSGVHQGTSEVDVTLRDVEHPIIAWKKSAVVAPDVVSEDEDGTTNSHTTACKTSPSQMSRQNSIASIASRKSMFYEDFRNIQEGEHSLPGLMNAQNGTFDVAGAEEVEAKILPSPTPEAQKVAAVQSNEFVSGIFKDDPLRKSVFIKVPTPAAPVQQIQKVKFAQTFERQPLQQQHLRPFSAPRPATRVAVSAAARTTLPIPEHTPSKEIVKRLERMTAENSPKRISLASVPKVPARLSNLEYWRVKELGSSKLAATPSPQKARQTAAAATNNTSPSVRQLSRKLQGESFI